MEILNLTQGTDEWLEARLDHLTASEAAAMMGNSKYMSRNQLLDLKKGWQSQPDDSFKQRLFQQGHEHEAMARNHLEMEMFEDILPVVGRNVVDGLELLASFDGYIENRLIWEHKDWNKVLVTNVINNVLESHYYWQLEHQMLVAGWDRVMFVVSDGTTENREEMLYQSEPERRENLIAGWKQFVIDLASHELKAKQEVIVAETINLPVVAYQITGTDISSNIADCIEQAKDLSAVEMNSTIETVQDEKNKKLLTKNLKAMRDKLKETVLDVKNQFVSFSEFSDQVKQLDDLLQQIYSHGEKQVKDSKEARKQDFIEQAKQHITQHIAECDEQIAPYSITQIMGVINTNWKKVTENKRTDETLMNAISEELSRSQVAINQVMERIVPNMDYLASEAADHGHLFNDVTALLNESPMAFQAIVKQRITEYKAVAAKRLEADRERIRQEEQRKAEAEAARKMESERQRIAQEERQKLKAVEKIEELFKVPETQPVKQPSVTEPHHNQPTDAIPPAKQFKQTVQKQSGFPVTDFDDTAYQMNVLEQDFSHLKHWYSQQTLQELLVDEQGNEYELMLTIKRVRMK